MGLLNRMIPMFAVIGLGCAPDFEVDLALVDRPRVLALASTPAEAAPGETVMLTALVATPEGTSVDAMLDWSTCLARRPLAELGPIAADCVGLEESAIAVIGQGVSVEATLPSDACRLFGPEPPPAMPGEPTGRPVDPDPTGGYYQPILGTFDDGELNLLKVRLACGLAGATQAQAAEYTLRYRRNVAPAVAEFGLVDGSASIGPGEHVDLRLRWAECPEQETEEGCTGAETHVFFDPLALEVATRREAIAVAWYATAGEFDDARTGRGSADLEPSSDNGWTAPSEPGTVHFWVVLRDDRGGVGWAELDVEIE
jgi:hypothetical protein